MLAASNKQYSICCRKDYRYEKEDGVLAGTAREREGSVSGGATCRALSRPEMVLVIESRK
ncbi:MAG: hypothetical protein IMY82_00725 [Chloroflexi bacterium]|nr:hypothetical protein [Chloroflexota bacterium]